MRSGSAGPRMGDAHADVPADVGDSGAVGVSGEDRDLACRKSSCDRADREAC